MEKITAPRIVFKLSQPYFEIFKQAWLIEHPTEKHPSYAETFSWMKGIEGFWESKKNGTLEALAVIAELEWKHSEIPCYIIGRHRASWSDPLTISLTAYTEMGPEYFFRVLMHELIHNLLADNKRLCGINWILRYLDQKYDRKESYLAKIHVLVHAIHAMLHCDYLRGNMEEVNMAEHPDYLKSWEIIEREGGYKKVVTDFISHISERSGNYH